MTYQPRLNDMLPCEHFRLGTFFFSFRLLVHTSPCNKTSRFSSVLLAIGVIVCFIFVATDIRVVGVEPWSKGRALG